ncbi:MAG: PAS domain-containing sensor histidine kinase [Proteobacteria bacterium]|uniref:PAS domain S-box protein n=1 Tax=Aquabacterium sp. TaxID=1872578 RepID=UPI0035C75B9B|nr:PAS domain-containing sensor histidine kinase [Pseudomonadota bacterium]
MNGQAAALAAAGMAGFVAGALLARLATQRRAARAHRRGQEGQRVLREFQAMVESANDAMLLMEGARVVECNAAALAMFRLSRAELLGAHPADLSPERQPDGQSSMALASHNIERVMAGESKRILWQHVRGDGEHFMADVALSPVRDGDAQATPRFVAVLRDVTESLHASEAIQASEQRFRQLFELAPIPMVLTSADGRLLDINRQWTQVLGYAPEEVPDMEAWWLLAYPDAAYRDAVKTLWDKGIDRVLHQGGELVPAVFRVQCKDGRSRDLRVGGARIGDNVLTSFYDVTEQRAAQAAMQALNATLEARVSERTGELQSAIEDLKRTQEELVRSEKLAGLGALVAGVAHELNTPIGNAVIVASTLADQRKRFEADVAEGLRKSTLARFMGEVQEGVEVMERNLRRAAELISGFKQVAVDQSSHQRRDFELAELVRELQLTLSPTLKRSGLRLHTDVPPGLQFDSHPGPLTQVLMNVINNAVVHAFGNTAGTPASAPDATVWLQAQALPEGRVQITLRDNGRGIAAEHLPRVFDPFFTTRLGKGGSGLGMHIVYSLVTELLGGTVHIDSTVGEGTTVTLNLPQNAPDGTPPPPASSPSDHA